MGTGTVAPDVLPADFNGWDKGPPDVLPADFKGWDAAPPAGAASSAPDVLPADFNGWDKGPPLPTGLDLNAPVLRGFDTNPNRGIPSSLQPPSLSALTPDEQQLNRFMPAQSQFVPQRVDPANRPWAPRPPAAPQTLGEQLAPPKVTTDVVPGAPVRLQQPATARQVADQTPFAPGDLYEAGARTIEEQRRSGAMSDAEAAERQQTLAAAYPKLSGYQPPEDVVGDLKGVWEGFRNAPADFAAGAQMAGQNDAGVVPGATRMISAAMAGSTPLLALEMRNPAAARALVAAFSVGSDVTSVANNVAQHYGVDDDTRELIGQAAGLLAGAGAAGLVHGMGEPRPQRARSAGYVPPDTSLPEGEVASPRGNYAPPGGFGVGGGYDLSDPLPGSRAARAAAAAAARHPSGVVTGIDQATGLPIVDRTQAAPAGNVDSVDTSGGRVENSAQNRQVGAQQPVGAIEPESGRVVTQPTDRLATAQKLATAAAPELESKLADAVGNIQGATLDAIRDEKDPVRAREKAQQGGQPPETMSDLLAGRIMVDSPAARDQVIAELRRRFGVVKEDDHFEHGNDAYGFRSHDLQVRMGNGSTAEVQVVPREVALAEPETRGNYERGRAAEAAGDTQTAAQYQGANRRIHANAMREFNARNGAAEPAGARGSEESSLPTNSVVEGGRPNALHRGDRVAMPDGSQGTVRFVHPELGIARVERDGGGSETFNRKDLRPAGEAGGTGRDLSSFRGSLGDPNGRLFRSSYGWLSQSDPMQVRLAEESRARTGDQTWANRGYKLVEGDARHSPAIVLNHDFASWFEKAMPGQPKLEGWYDQARNVDQVVAMMRAFGDHAFADDLERARGAGGGVVMLREGTTRPSWREEQWHRAQDENPLAHEAGVGFARGGSPEAWDRAVAEVRPFYPDATEETLGQEVGAKLMAGDDFGKALTPAEVAELGRSYLEGFSQYADPDSLPEVAPEHAQALEDLRNGQGSGADRKDEGDLSRKPAADQRVPGGDETVFRRSRETGGSGSGRAGGGDAGVGPGRIGEAGEDGGRGDGRSDAGGSGGAREDTSSVQKGGSGRIDPRGAFRPDARGEDGEPTAGSRGVERGRGWDGVSGGSDDEKVQSRSRSGQENLDRGRNDHGVIPARGNHGPVVQVGHDLFSFLEKTIFGKGANAVHLTRRGAQWMIANLPRLGLKGLADAIRDNPSRDGGAILVRPGLGARLLGEEHWHDFQNVYPEAHAAALERVRQENPEAYERAKAAVSKTGSYGKLDDEGIGKEITAKSASGSDANIGLDDARAIHDSYVRGLEEHTPGIMEHAPDVDPRLAGGQDGRSETVAGSDREVRARGEATVSGGQADVSRELGSGPEGEFSLDSSSGSGPGRDEERTGAFGAFRDWIDERVTPADRTKEVIRDLRGGMDRRIAIVAQHLDAARKVWNKRPRAESQKFWDAVERGDIASLPHDDQFLAQYFADGFKRMREEIRQLRPEALEQYVRDYFPHIWKDPVEAAKVIAQAMDRKGSIAGRGEFLKQRQIPTMAEGIALGLEPWAWNPVDMFLKKYESEARYLHGYETLDSMKDMGVAKLIRPGQDIPPGWKKIDDRIGQIRSMNDAGELVIRGDYYAAPGAAKVFNRYVSQGLAGRYTTYDMFRKLADSSTAMQLGISAFHVTMTAKNAMASEAGLALQQLLEGKPISAVGHALSAVTVVPSIARQFRNGRLLSREYLTPGSYAKFSREAQMFESAGGRIGEGPLRVRPFSRIANQWKSGEYIQAGVGTPFAILHLVVAPIMDHWVPALKAGAFYDMAHNTLDNAQRKGWSEEQTRRRVQQNWDSVDDRFGQLVYDNLFLHKVLRDALQVSVRAVGWQAGTLRTYAGAATDTARQVARLATGRGFRMTDRMAFAIAETMLTSAIGAVMTKLTTGHGPQEPKDYTTPKNSSGTRISIPGYTKDLVAGFHDPGQTILNKMSPPLSMASQLLHNRDYYGVEVRHEDDPLWKQALEVGGFGVSSLFTPFAFSGTQKLLEGEGEDASMNWRHPVESGSRIGGALWRHKGDFFAGQFGFQPAPAYVQNSDALNAAHEYEAKNAPMGTRTQAQYDRQHAMHLIEQMYRTGRVNQQQIDGYLDRGTLSDADVSRAIVLSSADPLVRAVRRLTLEQALDVYDKATPEEKEQLAPVVRAKGGRLLQEEPESKRDGLQARLDAVGR